MNLLAKYGYRTQTEPKGRGWEIRPPSEFEAKFNELVTELKNQLNALDSEQLMLFKGYIVKVLTGQKDEYNRPVGHSFEFYEAPKLSNLAVSEQTLLWIAMLEMQQKKSLIAANMEAALSCLFEIRYILPKCIIQQLVICIPDVPSAINDEFHVVLFDQHPPVIKESSLIKLIKLTSNTISSLQVSSISELADYADVYFGNGTLSQTVCFVIAYYKEHEKWPPQIVFSVELGMAILKGKSQYSIPKDLTRWVIKRLAENPNDEIVDLLTAQELEYFLTAITVLKDGLVRKLHNNKYKWCEKVWVSMLKVHQYHLLAFDQLDTASFSMLLKKPEPKRQIFNKLPFVDYPASHLAMILDHFESYHELDLVTSAFHRRPKNVLKHTMELATSEISKTYLQGMLSQRRFWVR